MYFYNARYYDPTIGRFIQADTIVPGSGPLTVSPSDATASRSFYAENKPENRTPLTPQALNRYSYVINNPLKYEDSTGHCWGWAAGIRNLQVGSYGMGTNCNNIDMALYIVNHPNVSPNDKSRAISYLGLWGIAIVSGGVGAGLLVCELGPACAAVAQRILQVGVGGGSGARLLNNIKQAYSNYSNRELNQLISSDQRQLLRDFFGSSVQGAKDAWINFQIPQNLSKQTLEMYGELARRAIEQGNDPLGVQAARLQLILRALETME